MTVPPNIQAILDKAEAFKQNYYRTRIAELTAKLDTYLNGKVPQSVIDELDELLGKIKD